MYCLVTLQKILVVILLCFTCNRWFRELFDSADVNGDGSLSLKEVGRLFQKLNIDAAHKDVKRRFQVCTI